MVSSSGSPQTVLSEVHSIALLDGMVCFKTSRLHVYMPAVHLLFYKVSYLVQCSVRWEAVPEKSNSLAALRQWNWISHNRQKRICANELLPLPKWNKFSVVNLTWRGYWATKGVIDGLLGDSSALVSLDGRLDIQQWQQPDTH